MMKVGHSAFCKKYLPLVGRIGLALLFLVSGFGFLTNFAGTAGYFTSLGLPAASVLLVLVIIVKIGGGLSLITGWHAREGALALVVFTALATVIGHSNIGDQMQLIQALKNLAIIGGLFQVIVNGPGPLSIGCSGPCCKGTCEGGTCSCDCSHGTCNCSCKKDASGTMPQA